jgi:hypothetical protein
VVKGEFHVLKDGTRVWDKPGFVAWKNDTGSGKYLKRAGTVAGSVTTLGYRTLSFRFDNKPIRILAHRVAWMLSKRKMFQADLHCDHMDHDVSNNDPRNLRETKASGNNVNRKAAQSNSRFGLLGVYWYAARGKWCVQIFRDARKYCGYFEDPVEAVTVYWKCKIDSNPGMKIHWLAERKKQLDLARKLCWVRKKLAPKRNKYTKAEGKWSDDYRHRL